MDIIWPMLQNCSTYNDIRYGLLQKITMKNTSPIEEGTTLYISYYIFWNLQICIRLNRARQFITKYEIFSNITIYIF